MIFLQKTEKLSRGGIWGGIFGEQFLKLCMWGCPPDLPKPNSPKPVSPNPDSLKHDSPKPISSNLEKVHSMSKCSCFVEKL